MTEIRRRTRLLFINAALKCFAERGYRGATIRNICQKAGYSTGALYNHFRNKEQLFRDVFQHSGLQLQDDMRRTQGQSPRDQLQSFSSLTQKHQRFLRLFDVDAHLGAGETKRFLEKLKHRLRFFAPKQNAGDVVKSLQISAALQRADVDVQKWVDAIFLCAEPHHKLLAA